MTFELHKRDKKPENPPAFPLGYARNDEKKEKKSFVPFKGMTLLDYLIAHAPENPQWDFDVPMDTERPKPDNVKENTAPMALTICINEDEIQNWENRRKKKKAQMWATEWAKTQLKERKNHI